MKILNFGSCNIDFVYSMDHIVKTGETEAADRLDVFPGGKGLNQSIAASKAGAAVFHAGCVGSDGQMLVQILEKNGVDTTWLQAVDSKNGHAIIQVSAGGENSIFLYPGSNEMVTKEYIDKVLEHFEAGDMLLVQNEISNVDHIVETAFQKGMTIVLNPSPFNGRIEAIDLEKVSYLILNEVEAKGFSGSEDPNVSLAYLKARYPKLKVMLTLGKEGSVFMDSGRTYTHAAFEVETVDTTAAGDTFTGYFVAGISRGEAVETILKTASAAAAIAVSRMGAAPSIPGREEVLAAKFLEKEKF